MLVFQEESLRLPFTLQRQIKYRNMTMFRGKIETYSDKIIIAERQMIKEICIEILRLYIWKCLVHEPHCVMMINELKKRLQTRGEGS